MSNIKPLDHKIFHYFIHLYDTPDTQLFFELLKSSTINIETYVSPIVYNTVQKLHIYVSPVLYKGYQNIINEMKIAITKKYELTYNTKIDQINIYPKLEEFHVVDNRYIAQITPWQNINAAQEHILKLLRSAYEIIDFQNIGNACRTLITNLADIVFQPQIHTPEDETIDVSRGKSKNRLYSYVKKELIGKENKEMREFSISVIETCENSIVLANALTHDLKASSIMAEYSVISAFTTVNIVHLIHKGK
ncbi:MAG: hypothetical protein KBB37_02800 [Bacteroidia bacterium]|nr:hypothetical protein [Bacteroidia bacterium]MBP7260191.1 hypothetical protein [Bacteroidia bacterium]MBP9181080.1 hypothetical protein [Bacteroidia bacterium]MBP9723843.1 hypothetical protein [Bacteroidia bacterium]